MSSQAPMQDKSSKVLVNYLSNDFLLLTATPSRVGSSRLRDLYLSNDFRAFGGEIRQIDWCIVTSQQRRHAISQQRSEFEGSAASTGKDRNVLRNLVHDEIGIRRHGVWMAVAIKSFPNGR
mmetsp:Transcript_9688/g.20639  ORF Transcript_9688/g.20639 Transcript_9688/m.20639 type:complete len:121 (-) Transcript_9688:421-783(-)